MTIDNEVNKEIPEKFKSPLNKQEKNIHLREFNKYYYSNHGHGFKFTRMPYWIDSYGFWMNKEAKKELPKYYRVFKRGTVVMVDFGIQVGSEFSGPHFAVVLNRKDSKYSKVLTVVPLSSKKRPTYANLGTELLDRIVDKVNSMLNETDRLSNELEAELDDFKNSFGENSSIKFSGKDADILKASGITHDNNFHLTITVGGENLEVRKTLSSIESSHGFQDSPALISYTHTIHECLHRADKLEEKLARTTAMVPAFRSLMKKSNKYNKQTFANTGNITTVSKLKVVKFSSGNVSENIILSEDVLTKIQNKLNQLI